ERRRVRAEIHRAAAGLAPGDRDALAGTRGASDARAASGGHVLLDHAQAPRADGAGAHAPRTPHRPEAPLLLLPLRRGVSADTRRKKQETLAKAQSPPS